MSKAEIEHLKKRILSLEIQIRADVNKRRPYTDHEFKKTFKIGDMICGWSTGLTVEITAIDEKRFLAMDYKSKERVCTIAAHEWILVPEVKHKNNK